jgi:hypothetical protein
VRCGHCASIFVASQDSADAPSGGLLGGIKGMVRSFTTPYADVQANDATEPDLELELDGAPPSPAPLPSSPSTTGVLHLDIGGATSTGRVRSRNEDSHGTIHWTRSNLDQHHEVAAIVVADGMCVGRAGSSGGIVR